MFSGDTSSLAPRPDSVDRSAAAFRNECGVGISNDFGMSFHGQAIMHNASWHGKCVLHHETRYNADMTEKSERLKQARERAGYQTAKEAAVAMGVKVPSYIQHENGIRGFPNSVAERYARFLKVTPEWLTHGIRMGESESFIKLGPRIYVKGDVAAGVWREAWELPPSEWEVFTGRSDITAPLKDRFGLRIVGDSMNMVYPPGSVIECVAHYGGDIPNGKRVVVKRTDAAGQIETTVKEFMRDDKGISWLLPRSTDPNFQAPLRLGLPSDRFERIEIIGVVVASIRPE